jgi:hypothetical protein
LLLLLLLLPPPGVRLAGRLLTAAVAATRGGATIAPRVAALAAAARRPTSAARRVLTPLLLIFGFVGTGAAIAIPLLPDRTYGGACGQPVAAPPARAPQPPSPKDDATPRPADAAKGAP